MTPELKKLLEVLEQGGEHTQDELRLIAAANRALDALLSDGRVMIADHPAREAATILQDALVGGGWRASS